MLINGTDWNRHHGVGATLLENWVEERAVGEKILEERASIAALSKAGHSVCNIRPYISKYINKYGHVLNYKKRIF
jgi:hypothetical protein